MFYVVTERIDKYKIAQNVNIFGAFPIGFGVPYRADIISVNFVYSGDFERCFPLFPVFDLGVKTLKLRHFEVGVGERLLPLALVLMKPTRRPNRLIKDLLTGNSP